MIDWDRIAELQAEVGEDGLAEVLELFFEEFEETLEAALASDGAAPLDALHFLKGSASNIGMGDVAKICLDGEVAIKSGADKEIDFAEIATAFRESRAELQEVLSC